MSTTHKLLRFGVFELNLTTEELRKSGTLVKLQPQPFKLLALLASRAGQIVTREEIEKLLWDKQTFVEFDGGVNKGIRSIRNALNDNADLPRYIETFPRRGYRFIPEVVSTTVEAPPRVKPSQSDVQRRPDPLKDLPGVESGPPVVKAPETPDVTSGIATGSTTGESPRNDDAGRKRLNKWKRIAAYIPTLIVELRSHVWRARLVWISVVAVALVGSIAVGRYIYEVVHPPLTEKDTIVIADFDNNTGDSVFDATLRQGLWAALGQSPFLNILSDRRIRETLDKMGVPKSAALTPAFAREVCVRTGSAATLEGAIARLGTQYVLSLKAVNCSSGDEMAIEQVTAESKEKIVPALGNAASRIRPKLGESLRSVQQHDTPLEDVTTPSLEALQAYSLALKAASTSGPVAALPLYKRAMELDPNFALAYLSLAVEYTNLDQPGRASENARKAYELRAKVSEKERLYIEAYYRLYATGELEKAVQVFELWQQAFPREYWPYGMLSAIYMELGNWEKVLTQAIDAIRLAPDNNIGYVNAAGAYLALNRLEDAEATLKQAEERGLWSEDMLVDRYQLAFLKGDTARMRQLIDSAEAQAGVESRIMALQADTEAWYGKLRNARDYTKRAMDSAEHNDAKEAAAGYQTVAALREVEFGNRQQGKSRADAALQLARNRDVQAMAALALARAGDTAKADNLAAALDNAFPLDTLVQKYWLPTIRAAVALQGNDPYGAIEVLRATKTIELSQPIPTEIDTFLYSVYLRGEAYLILHDGKAAAAEFQRFIDYRGAVGNNPLGALARLGLARAYVKQGDTAKARAAYQDFLTLWKDAEPNIPLYKQAKAENAQLGGNYASWRSGLDLALVKWLVARPSTNTWTNGDGQRWRPQPVPSPT